ncbi:hypothetical protein RRF57_009261 [Xylaria bambusicola]|uniref:Uncharacterized protein n=1 Tax=Xylaria bambusicola TaxID=326684 RepID=A0AAN7ZBV0_9PEZI
MKVGIRSLADKRHSYLVTSDSNPYLVVKLAQGVAGKVSAQGQVLLKPNEMRLDGLEIAPQRLRNGNELVYLHFAL